MHSICVKKAQNSFQLRQNFYSLQTCTYFVIKKLIGKNIETHRSLFSKNTKNEMDNPETRTRAELVLASSNACAIPLH